METDEWGRYDGLWTDAGGGPTASEMEDAYREAKVGSWAYVGNRESANNAQFWT